VSEITNSPQALQEIWGRGKRWVFKQIRCAIPLLREASSSTLLADSAAGSNSDEECTPNKVKVAAAMTASVHGDDFIALRRRN